MQNRRLFGEIELKPETQELFQGYMPHEFPFIRFMVLTKEEYGQRDDALSHARLAPKGYVLISKERLAELLTAEDKLRCLEAGGVDCWAWYEDSLDEQKFKETLAESILDGHTEE